MHWLSFPICLFRRYKPLLLNGCWCFLEGRSITCQSGRPICPSIWHGGIYPFHSSHYFSVWSCLLWPSSVSGSIPFLVHYLPASMGYRHHPSSLHMCSFQGLQPNHFTCGLHPSPVDTPVNVHDPSCNFPFFHPREALLVGHQVTALPFFSCGILSSSPPMEVVLHGVGLVHLSCVWWLPIHKGMATSDRWEEASFGGGLMTIHVGSSLHRRVHQPWFVIPPSKSLLPTYP